MRGDVVQNSLGAVGFQQVNTGCLLYGIAHIICITKHNIDKKSPSTSKINILYIKAIEKDVDLFIQYMEKTIENK